MFQAPTQTPPIDMLLDALPTRCPQRIGRHLGVSAATVTRWARSGNAPRLAHLALWFESPWGLNALHCQAANGERTALALARALRDENDALRACLVHLEAVALEGGSANAPWFDPGRPPPGGAARRLQVEDRPGRMTGRGVMHKVRL